MLRSINSAENCLFSDPPNVITVAAATPTILFQSEQGIRTGEIAYRQIQNVGGNSLYFSFGLLTNDIPPKAVCDATINFNGYLTPGQQLDCSNDRQTVCGYSTGGTIVSTTIKRRTDLTH